MARDLDLERLAREYILPVVGENPSLSAKNDTDDGAAAPEHRPAIDLAALLAALEEADRIARALDLPRVRIRIANARREARR